MSAPRTAALAAALAAVLVCSGGAGALAATTPGPDAAGGAEPTTTVPPSTTTSAPALPTGDADAITDSRGRLPYPGDSESEAQHVAEEDRRLVEVDTIATLARWSGGAVNREPYRLATGSAYTLVLTPRAEAYTVRDLLDLAPQTFVRQPGGAYLLSENIVVLPGATLELSGAGRLELRLASDNKGFVSIVNSGGRLIVAGTSAQHVRITSWDRQHNTADTTTIDGRAYLRSVGGQVSLDKVDLASLGFWSGRTGGLSLTGTDRPHTGQLDDLGQAVKLAGTKTKRLRQEAQAAKATESDVPSPGASPQGSLRVDGILPAGTLPVPTDDTMPTYSYVSASIHDVSVDQSAYGLFVASANGVDIRRSRFTRSLVDGLVMHRYVTNAVVERTSASHNAGDGMVLSRATTGIVLSEVTASSNHRNGVTVSGLPLATGPNATGAPVTSYGNNAVSNSTFTDNGRHGVEVIGGTNVSVQGNDLVRNGSGVVVRDGSRSVSVVGNQVSGSREQGIALRDGVTDANVSGNVVSGGTVSLQLRDSSGVIRRNTLVDASSHGVSLVGAAGGVRMEGNVVSGRGPSAVDTQRAVDADTDSFTNSVAGWDDTTPFLVTLKRYLQPLTLLWLALAALVVVTALRGWRRPRTFAHPYAATASIAGPAPGEGVPT